MITLKERWSKVYKYSIVGWALTIVLFGAFYAHYKEKVAELSKTQDMLVQTLDNLEKSNNIGKEQQSVLNAMADNMQICTDVFSQYNTYYYNPRKLSSKLEEIKKNTQSSVESIDRIKNLR